MAASALLGNESMQEGMREREWAGEAKISEKESNSYI
jgi:hypothetical protein